MKSGCVEGVGSRVLFFTRPWIRRGKDRGCPVGRNPLATISLGRRRQLKEHDSTIHNLLAGGRFQRDQLCARVSYGHRACPSAENCCCFFYDRQRLMPRMEQRTHLRHIGHIITTRCVPSNASPLAPLRLHVVAGIVCARPAARSETQARFHVFITLEG